MPWPNNACAALTAIALWLISVNMSHAQQPVADTKKVECNDAGKVNVRPFDWPQWGGTSHRNNTPCGKNIPIDWAFASKILPDKNIKWSAKLGSATYSSPAIANGKVFIGTNNGAGYVQRFPATVNLGCLLCFDEDTGAFQWQHSNEKLKSGRVHDYPLQGAVSVPLVDGDRLWYVSNGVALRRFRRQRRRLD